LFFKRSKLHASIVVVFAIICGILLGAKSTVFLLKERFAKLNGLDQMTNAELMSLFDHIYNRDVDALYSDLPGYKFYANVAVAYALQVDEENAPKILGDIFDQSSSNINLQSTILLAWERHASSVGLEHIRQQINADVAAGREPHSLLVRALLNYDAKDIKESLECLERFYNAHPLDIDKEKLRYHRSSIVIKLKELN